MPPLIDGIRRTLASPRGSGRPVCLVCGRGLAPDEARLRVRGGDVVHRSCATYSMRRRRKGPSRLGYPVR